MLDETQLEDVSDSMKGRYLTFALGEEVFGIGINFVKEIIDLQPINPIPEAPEYIKGIINLRGRVFPVIDMRLKFKKQPEPYTDRTCIIVIDTKENSVGLIVDQVAEVLSMKDEDIAPPLGEWTGTSRRYLSGIGKQDNNIILLLDCEKLFTEDEITIRQTEDEITMQQGE
ncbi:MAG: chemotaxis protein CheW [Burkholderiales bacterium]